MKEIRKPKFMQAAAVKRGHGIFGEICIAIALFIVGSMAGGIIQVPAMMFNMLGNNEYIKMITSGQPDINKMMQLISDMPEWMTIVTLISESVSYTHLDVYKRQLLTLDTLSQLITAQNFSMPAGYIDDKNDDQWLIQIGENYESAKQIKNMVLTKVKGVGSIKISDVANVVTVDNVGDQYAKINGKDSVMLAIYKSSTASTSDVTNALTDSFKELEGKYKGLSITPLSNQGDFIKNIISSVLSSIVMGAILAIIVLALFLKDVRPTVVVAFSIPFSVLFALVIMYFTGININVMSLAGDVYKRQLVCWVLYLQL